MLPSSSIYLHINTVSTCGGHPGPPSGNFTCCSSSFFSGSSLEMEVLLQVFINNKLDATVRSKQQRRPGSFVQCHGSFVSDNRPCRIENILVRLDIVKLAGLFHLQLHPCFDQPYWIGDENHDSSSCAGENEVIDRCKLVGLRVLQTPAVLEQTRFQTFVKIEIPANQQMIRGHCG